MEKLELTNIDEKVASLFIKDENGVIVPDKTLDFIVDALNTNIEKAQEDDKKFREALKKFMVDNGLISATTDKYNVSLVVPKDKESFNAEEFVKNESHEIVDGFAKISKTKEFNEEILKEKYPEIYDACCEEFLNIEVDTKALKKYYENIFNKYNIITPATGKTTLRIAEKNTGKKAKK